MSRLLLMTFLAFSALLFLPNTEVSAQEQDYFYFPMEEGNVWLYRQSEYPSCLNLNVYSGCNLWRLEVQQTVTNNTRKCATLERKQSLLVFDSSTGYQTLPQRTRQFQLCQEENRVFQFYEETDIEDPFTVKYMIADFDRDDTQPWVIAENIIWDPETYPYILRRLDRSTVTNPREFLFQSYLGKDSTDLTLRIDYKLPYNYPGHFEEGTGFKKYPTNSGLIGHVIKGELSGDTTFVHAVSVEFSDDTPHQIQLDAYPNPFNPAATINIHLPAASHTSLKVYDLLGRQVGILNSNILPAGPHRFTFDATHLPGGIYIVKLRTENETAIRKITLLK